MKATLLCYQSMNNFILNIRNTAYSSFFKNYNTKGHSH